MNHASDILDLIDHALNDRFSSDAMRWKPESQEPKPGNLTGVRENDSYEPLGPELYRHLVDTLHSVPPPQRQNAHWVMNAEWFYEILRMADAAGRPLWTPALASTGTDTLLGLPIEVRSNGGVPQLEQFNRDLNIPERWPG